MISSTISSGSSPPKPCLSSAPSMSALLRSAAIASSTPGYWTLTATAVRRRCRGRRRSPGGPGRSTRRRSALGSNSTNSRRRAVRRARLRRRRRELGRHRGCVRLELGEGQTQRFGQPVVEVAGHLAELHQRALHVAELGRRPARRCGARAARRARSVARSRRTSCGRPSSRRCRRPWRPTCATLAERPAQPSVAFDATLTTATLRRVSGVNSTTAGRSRARPHRVDGAEQRGHEAVGARRRPHRDRRRLGTRRRSGSSRTAAPGGVPARPVAHRDHDRRRHVDLADPVGRRVTRRSRRRLRAPSASRVDAACSIAHGSQVPVLRCR